jgi:hypothetical protein
LIVGGLQQTFKDISQVVAELESGAKTVAQVVDEGRILALDVEKSIK